MQNVWITFLHGGRGRVYNYNNYMETIYMTKLVKIGTSHGVIIPTEILNGYHWQRGDFLVFGFAGADQLFLKRLTDLDLQKIKGNGFQTLH